MGFGENTANNDSTLMAPVTDPSTPDGVMKRKKLFRAWVELSAWLLDYKRVHSKFIFVHLSNQFFECPLSKVLHCVITTDRNFMFKLTVQERCISEQLVLILTRVSFEILSHDCY